MLSLPDRQRERRERERKRGERGDRERLRKKEGTKQTALLAIAGGGNCRRSRASKDVRNLLSHNTYAVYNPIIRIEQTLFPIIESIHTAC